MNLPLLRRYYEMRKSALGVSLVATAGVVLLGVLQGIVVAVLLAIILFFRRNWWPHGAVWDAGGDWRDGTTSSAYPEPKRWRASSSTAGRRRCSSPTAGRFRDEVRRLVREREPGWIVLQCEAVTDVDVTAAEMLEQLDRELNASGIHLAFVELRDRLKELTLRYGLMDTLDKDHFYPSIEAAIAAIRSEGGGARS